MTCYHCVGLRCVRLVHVHLCHILGTECMLRGDSVSVTVACRVPRRGWLTGHSIILDLCISTGARALTIALCPVKVCTNGGKLWYI